MPVFSNRAVIELARGIRAFLNLEAGITRGGLPYDGSDPSESEVSQRASRMRGTAEKEELKRLRLQVREQAKSKNREINALRAELAGTQAELAEARSGRRAPIFSDTGAPVFFVLGNAKSGTSWLMRTLNSHPEILCRGEGRFFERSFEQMVEPEALEDGRSKFVQSTSLYGALSSSEHLRTWIDRSIWTDSADGERHLGNLTRLAVNYFLTDRLSRTDKRIVGDKTPFSSAEVVEEISVVYPEAKVVHVVRDGRDVAVSMIHHLWNHAGDMGGIYDLEPEELKKRDAYRKAGSTLAEGLFAEWRLEGIARRWGEQVGKAADNGRALLGNSYTEVRYEDLSERPEEELGRLLGFLGADAGEQTVRHCIEAGSFEKWAKGRKRGEEASSSFFRKGIVGDWRNVFTEEDKRVFKATAAGEALIQLGYERDDGW